MLIQMEKQGMSIVLSHMSNQHMPAQLFYAGLYCELRDQGPTIAAEALMWLQCLLFLASFTWHRSGLGARGIGHPMLCIRSFLDLNL
jgi:hypothetical protein